MIDQNVSLQKESDRISATCKKMESEHLKVITDLYKDKEKAKENNFSCSSTEIRLILQDFKNQL